jgi:hypothetical protein
MNPLINLFAQMKIHLLIILVLAMNVTASANAKITWNEKEAILTTAFTQTTTYLTNVLGYSEDLELEDEVITTKVESNISIVTNSHKGLTKYPLKTKPFTLVQQVSSKDIFIISKRKLRLIILNSPLKNKDHIVSKKLTAPLIPRIHLQHCNLP